MSFGRQRPDERITSPLPFGGSSNNSVIMCSWNCTIFDVVDKLGTLLRKLV